MNNRNTRAIVTAVTIVTILLALIGICLPKMPIKNNTPPKATVQPLIDQKQNNYDSLVSLVNSLVKSIALGKNTIIVERNNLQSAYQNQIQTSPDVCLPAINLIYQYSMKLDSSNKAVIQKQDTTIFNQSKAMDELKDINSLQKFQLQQKQDSIAQLQDEKKQDRKKERREKVKQVGEKILYSVFSFGAGYSTGKLTK